MMDERNFEIEETVNEELEISDVVDEKAANSGLVGVILGVAAAGALIGVGVKTVWDATSDTREAISDAYTEKKDEAKQKRDAKKAAKLEKKAAKKAAKLEKKASKQKSKVEETEDETEETK